MGNGAERAGVAGVPGNGHIAGGGSGAAGTYLVWADVEAKGVTDAATVRCQLYLGAQNLNPSGATWLGVGSTLTGSVGIFGAATVGSGATLRVTISNDSDNEAEVWVNLTALRVDALN